MSDEVNIEVTLEQWISRLHDSHRARIAYEALVVSNEDLRDNLEEANDKVRDLSSLLCILVVVAAAIALVIYALIMLLL